MKTQTVEKADSFGRRIKKLREIAGISSTELADLVGLKPSAVRSWEAGNSYPRYSEMVKVQAYFNCSFDYLYGKNGFKHERIMMATNILENLKNELDQLRKEV